jgi:hypothetical protein
MEGSKEDKIKSVTIKVKVFRVIIKRRRERGNINRNLCS